MACISTEKFLTETGQVEKLEIVSDQCCWKKRSERDDLDLFLSAYAEVTDQILTVTDEDETPDFLCEKGNGERVGIELTKIIAHPESRRWHRLFGAGPINLAGDIACKIFEAAVRKTHAIRKAGWKTSETLLVIQLFDNPLNETYRGLDQTDVDDFTEFGFAEIWVTDHSTLETYDRVELFGIYPERVTGYYPLCAGSKPYG